MFVLAKDEEDNIGRCLSALSLHTVPVTVLDSGSTDRTREIAATFPRVSILRYRYVSHCDAGNEICSVLAQAEYAMLLDADMVVSAQLMREVGEFIAAGQAQVLEAPVSMWIDGIELKMGSLYPPKAFVFRTGRSYFVPQGHSEALGRNLTVARAASCLVHDDRKDYSAFLLSQNRYARQLLSRASGGALSVRDRLRISSPVMLLVAPIWAYVVRGGIFAGRAGVAYAMDRLIAEAIMFRKALSKRLSEVHGPKGRS